VVSLKEENDEVIHDIEKRIQCDCDWVAGDVKRRTEYGWDYLYVVYEYKKGSFNPWLHEKLFCMYLNSIDFGEITEGVSYGSKYINIICCGHRFNIYLQFIPGVTDNTTSRKQSIRVTMDLTYETVSDTEETVVSLTEYISLMEIVESYLLKGFDPGIDVLEELKQETKPVKYIQQDTLVDWDGHGRMMCPGTEISIYNASNELLYRNETSGNSYYLLNHIKRLNEDIEIEIIKQKPDYLWNR
jgi:hypothetical protein